MKSIALALVFVALFFTSLSAAERGGDITPPVLVAASLDRQQVDTNDSAQTITLSLHITDDLSGLHYVQITYVHPNGYNTFRSCDAWSELDYATDVIIPCSVSFPHYSAEGRWQVFRLAIVDRTGNRFEHIYSKCVLWSDTHCLIYRYASNVTELIRSMEIQIGPSQSGKGPVYLPFLGR